MPAVFLCIAVPDVCTRLEFARGRQRTGLFLGRHRAPFFFFLLTIFPEPLPGTLRFHSLWDYETWKTRDQRNATLVRVTKGKLVSGDEGSFAYERVRPILLIIGPREHPGSW